MKKTADFSAITTWGVFDLDEDGEPHLMLLDDKRSIRVSRAYEELQKNNMTIGSQKQLLLRQKRQDYH